MRATLCALALAATFASACAGPGYSIAGPAVRSPVPGLVLAGAEVAPTRAHPRPQIDVLLMCPGGSTQLAGTVVAQEVTDDGRRRVTLAPNASDGADFEVVFAAGSEAHLDIAAGESMQLRSKVDGSSVVCVGGYVAASASRAADTATGTGDVWTLTESTVQESLRLTGVVVAHGWDGRLWRFRLVVAGADGVTVEVRYTPIGQQGLAARPLQQVELEIRVAEAEAGFRGPSLVLRTPSGTLLSALAAGGGLVRPELPGVTLRPSRRVIYSEARQMPSLCLASIEHLALELRRGGTRTELPPGTYALVAHDAGDYKISALDLARPASSDGCGDEVTASLSYAITLTVGAPALEGTTSTGTRIDSD